MTGYTMGKDISKYSKVGSIPSEVSSKVGFDHTGDVLAAPGVLKHIVKRHGDQLSDAVLKDLIGTMETVIKAPDYVGNDSKKGGNGIEFIKKIDDNILVGIEFDVKENYIYVASMYPISEGKISNRLNSNRLKAFE